MDIWRLPRVLIIQLKRFITRGSFARKFDDFIEFPDELDMSEYVAGKHEHEHTKYRLYALSEHMGGTGGGHYTACALVGHRNQKSTHGKWYSFNDSSASETSIKRAHTNNAYMLFYECIVPNPTEQPNQ